MHEVELKFVLPDGFDLSGAATRLYGPPVSTVLERDTFLGDRNDRLASDTTLRVRQTGDSYELTYKGPRKAGDAKIREEWNVPTTTDPRPLLGAVGFEPRCRLEKHRTTWRDGDVTVVLDDLEGLGRFAEVEVFGKDIDLASQLIHAAAAKLGLADFESSTQAYVELALAAGAPCAQLIE